MFLFTPMTMKGMTVKNRVAMAPMCQYCVEKEDGLPTDWHFTHYVSRAVGGCGLIIVEAAAIEPDGRISNHDLGLWSDDCIQPLKRIVDEVHRYGAKIAIQLAHAGRKAKDAVVPVAPSVLPYPSSEREKYPVPRALEIDEIPQMVEKFAAAARRAVKAGFDSVEIHGAHGYLIHQFLSPSLNKRTDAYADYSAFGKAVVAAVKAEIPADMPLIMRLSAREYMDGGFGLDHALAMGQVFKEAGVDAFNISTGGDAPPGKEKPGNYPGYQVPFARAFAKAFPTIPVMAAGLLQDPALAEATVANGDADFICLGRELLRNPYWANLTQLHGEGEVTTAAPYQLGFK